jgi:hypothetical protein
MKTTRPSNRRKFLLAAGLGGAGALATVAGAKGIAGPVQQVDAVTRTTETKYRETDHIRKYYETTKV